MRTGKSVTADPAEALAEKIETETEWQPSTAALRDLILRRFTERLDATCAAAPDLWRRFIVDMRGGEVILAVKHETPLPTVRAALDRLGGLAAVAAVRPWVFDFLEMPPRQNYDR